MKKKSVRFVALAMIVGMMATCFAGCKKECDLCGEKAKCKSFTIEGEKVNLCGDCDVMAEIYNAFN